MPEAESAPRGRPGPPPAPVEVVSPQWVKAAAVLLGLGPDIAITLFRQFTEAELRRIALGAKELRKRGDEAVPDALGSFCQSMEKVGGEAAAGDDVLREVATRAVGADAARRAFDGIMPPPPPDEVLGPVSQADPEALAMVLQREGAQTMALVLSSLEPWRAAGVLERLPEKKRPEVLRRMATIESVAPEVLREVGQALSAELKALVAGGMRKVDGKKTALEILRFVPVSQQGAVLAEIERDDGGLAGELRGSLFTFEDLRNLADRDLQTLLREIDMKKLAVALKGATPEIKQKFMGNLSSRAAEMFQDDLAAMGPVKLATVEAAQSEIAKLAQDLAAQNRITIVGAGEKML
ncbi:flagellar motor switch protein FliG [Anaeromyxobacter paludicola]|uniref:Flagellar motor switch protein FliG n=1 Tax=Anaeromyxobacter paludicola TaxID=2918171 RepID=A0ABN6N464_9BACT|nr:flagellar motor switch protein FliG [Anaeromyxobacter paludicola]BDG07969.1 flagellar motor switch protein FliG [Anaeromyxobacter paludicola]